MLDIFQNPLVDLDFYKFSHWKQFKPKTTYLKAYLSSRGGPGSNPGTIMFGLQMLLDEMTRPITMEHVMEAKEVSDSCILGPSVFPLEGWEYIVKKLNGKIPLLIKAVPEGTYVDSHNALMTVESTDENVPWLTSWYETRLMRLWYTINTCTISNQIKQLIYENLLKTSDNVDEAIKFALLDFSGRGVGSPESAALAGAAHLANFPGTDNTPGALAVRKYYNHHLEINSVPAMEHASCTSFGRNGEVDSFRNMFQQFKGSPLISFIVDSYNIHNSVDNIWGKTLKEEALASGSTPVIRIDSGKLPDIVIEVIKSLENSYGCTINSKGFKVLNGIKILQSEGVNCGMIRLILFHLIKEGFSAENVIYGCGAALGHLHSRDTYQFGYKHSYSIVNGEPVDICKEPIDEPMKKSKSGDLDLIKVDGQFKTIARNRDTEYKDVPSELITVFKDGEIIHRYALDEIRKRIDSKIKEDLTVNV